ncbi:UPF0280 family protein [Lutimaribacter sp. EGI FJ00015]|uniref:UPF0280 family protein n=1 Tax=Lutimaribacter degradans TaxID=2945989 RepID=A0ACC5ZX09_9RHOB|nr:UPF0280 family protein [Lutimaribacter sp. EGI FJ00013]MCM2562635.1 UPF0280 family protein [Lutimaribacter sp. EGI FJ00013]MCO0613792.1 UPF0280 family protein [Lutimaribacter sp. EGI FJ00015]MCO0636725.1 UPF0280 family protein [Lutimaribacter sp. EGI FJ00014]
MTGPVAAILPGQRLHLQHGPIDLVIGADGDRDAAFAAATDRFQTVLEELVQELPLLRRPVGDAPAGLVAQRMHAACIPQAEGVTFVTPMAAVAGSVADEVLAAMVAAAPLTRAYVNNGGDIALYLGPGARFEIGLAGLDGIGLGRACVDADMAVRGVATSGAGGRSLSLGIADSVTVLAANAAAADVAATLIAGAVDLADHPEIRRVPASDVQDDSDLGDRPVVRAVGLLTPDEVARALAAGVAAARQMRQRGLIVGAALMLRGQARVVGDIAPRAVHDKQEEGILAHA